MRSVEIQIGCGAVNEIGCYPCHDEHGIYSFVRAFGFDYAEAMDLLEFVRLADNGQEYENGSMRAIVEDE